VMKQKTSTRTSAAGANQKGANFAHCTCWTEAADLATVNAT